MGEAAGERQTFGNRLSYMLCPAEGLSQNSLESAGQLLSSVMFVSQCRASGRMRCGRIALASLDSDLRDGTRRETGKAPQQAREAAPASPLLCPSWSGMSIAWDLPVGRWPMTVIATKKALCGSKPRSPCPGEQRAGQRSGALGWRRMSTPVSAPVEGALTVGKHIHTYMSC